MQERELTRSLLSSIIVDVLPDVPLLCYRRGLQRKGVSVVSFRCHVESFEGEKKKRKMILMNQKETGKRSSKWFRLYRGRRCVRRKFNALERHVDPLWVALRRAYPLSLSLSLSIVACSFHHYSLPRRGCMIANPCDFAQGRSTPIAHL